jgi:hypothetical protein
MSMSYLNNKIIKVNDIIIYLFINISKLIKITFEGCIVHTLLLCIVNAMINKY